ncbi:MAG: hypothetical protein JST66_04180 [Bacteroidetes bacterium]|nr:hypothetical protein [Bacteroidota bacterium]
MKLLSELGFTCTEESIDELFWRFSLSQEELELRLSWSLLERSMQTTILYRGVAVSTVSCERLSESSVSLGKVLASFEDERSITKLEIKITPSLEINWGTLEKRR